MHTLSLSNGGLKLHGVAFARRLAEIRVLTKARAVRPARACVVHTRRSEWRVKTYRDLLL